MHYVGRQARELLFDVLRGFRPHAIGMRVIGAPHERAHTHLVDQLSADAVELKRSFALAPPVVARFHLEAQVAETVFPLEIHAIQRIGDPTDAALAKRDAYVRIALEHARADDSGEDVDEIHLKA